MSAVAIHLPDERATEALGARLARALHGHAGGVVYLNGTLGAGKTTLVRGWLRALGVTGSIRSPTYTLIEPYLIDGRDWLHLDLYRLKSPDELDGLGLDDHSPTRCWWLVEWPECGVGHLPPPSLIIDLRAEDGARLAVIDTMALGEAFETALQNPAAT